MEEESKLSTNIEDTIFNHIVHYMKKVETIMTANGEEKKQYVLKQIKNVLGNETYERYEPFISASIDFVVSLSRNKKLLKGINSKSLCCIK